jgi:hypothetical protein
LVVGSLMVRRRLGVGLGLASVWKLYVASGLSAAVCYPVSFLVRVPQLSLVAGAVAFVVVFIPILALLKSMSEQEMASLRVYLGVSPLVSKPLELALRYYGMFA